MFVAIRYLVLEHLVSSRVRINDESTRWTVDFHCGWEVRSFKNNPQRGNEGNEQSGCTFMRRLAHETHVAPIKRIKRQV